MAVVHPYFLNYLCSLMRQSVLLEQMLYCDPVLIRAESCAVYKPDGSYTIVHVISNYFKDRIITHPVDGEVERKAIVLKTGYPALPATKLAIILKGFGYDLTVDQVRAIYASYGLVRSLKDLALRYDFMDINRRIDRLALLANQDDTDEACKVQQRYQAIRGYLLSGKGEKEKVINKSKLGRSLFFYYLKSFASYGMLGLIDKGAGYFRNSKVGKENEAHLVIDKIQHPEHQESFYLQYLLSKGIRVDRSCVAKIFSRWQVSDFRSAFISDLKRLETESDYEVDEDDIIDTGKQIPKYVDVKFMEYLKLMRTRALYIDAPGLLVLWAYLDELGIYHPVSAMGLAYVEKGYSWFDHLLLNIGRIFYGIPSYSRVSEHEEPSLCLFSHLAQLPCNDSFINGLSTINQEQTFQLQKWLVSRIKELGLVEGRRLSFDFHHIDMDVKWGILRQFGKGPSPKKKICYNGFRPHIAWDLDTGSLVVAEFRKASARGTTTVKRFVKDFLLSLFKDIFTEVYIDSEYTGRDVWNFILDPQVGMGADIVACIKQNAFVKRHRDAFVLNHHGEDDFWCYWDDNHVYSKQTFPLIWEYQCSQEKKAKKFILTCVVKKNIKTGKLRCFGTSKRDQSSRQILEDYSHRWIIENGIKDLIRSFFLDKCPGTNPHQVNIHFLSVAICKHLYRMIQRDTSGFIENNDGSIRSLERMREYLFKQGSAKISLSQDTIEVHFLNSFSPRFTEHLQRFYDLLHKKTVDGLRILGGLKLKFYLKTPYGEEHRNGYKKVPLNLAENFRQTG